MSRLRLRPGIRVSERSDRTLQVGLHPGLRLVLPDDQTVRGALALLGHGVDPARLDPGQRELLGRLDRAGLVVDPDDAVTRSRAASGALVEVRATDPVRARLLWTLGEAGVGLADPGADGTVVVLATTGAEPPRDSVDELVRADRPHLLVTAAAGRLRVGPFVVPGLTACLRCVDEHVTDRDPRHPLVLEQHLVPDPGDLPARPDLLLALAWAARDVASLVTGERPTTWSATVDIEPGGPVTQHWRRHPRCGCAWGDALAG